MDTVRAERRAAPMKRGAADPAVVRHAVRLQSHLGTPGAVEYLKAHDVGADVISRVLSCGVVRGEDRA